MDLSFTEEQRMLRDSLEGFLADRYGFEQRQAMLSRPHSGASALWRAFADELGILGLVFPEEAGGLGGGPVDVMIVMEALGARLVLEPFLESVVLAGGVLKRSPSQLAQEIATRIVRGEACVTLAYAEPQARYCWHDVATSARRRGGSFLLNGHKAVVVGAPHASTLIVSARTSGRQRDRAGIALFAVDIGSTGLERRDYRLIDGRMASEIYLEDVEAPAEALLTGEDDGLPLLEQVLDEGAAAVCAEAWGVLRELQERTVDYTRQRRQFGVPISTFQVLQHRMVDMFIAAEQAISITYMATLHLDRPANERAKAVSAAKAKVGEACRFVGQSAVQLHGGMGVTDELAVSHYFKRATLIETQFGSTGHHLARYERLGFP